MNNPQNSKMADIPVTDEGEVPLGVERVEREREHDGEGERQRLQHDGRVVERHHHADGVRLHRRLVG